MSPRRRRGRGLLAAGIVVVVVAGGAAAGYLLTRGSSGGDVKALQAALAAAGYDPGDSDGDFGSQTVTALEDWQAAKDLDQTGRLALSSFVSFPPGSIVLDLPIALGDRVGAGGNLATVGGARPGRPGRRRASRTWSSSRAASRLS